MLVYLFLSLDFTLFNRLQTFFQSSLSSLMLHLYLSFDLLLFFLFFQFDFILKLFINSLNFGLKIVN